LGYLENTIELNNAGSEGLIDKMSGDKSS